MDVARSGRLSAYIGAAAQLVGLGWDAVLHSLDPELAAREGVFSLTNPGHVLFAGGLVLVVLGVALIVAGGRQARALRYGSLAALLLLSLSTVALAATGGGGLRGHRHSETLHVHEDGTTHTHDEHEAFVQQQGGTGTGEFGDRAQARHQHAPDVPISLGDFATLQEQLAAARAGTEKYRDIRQALKDGYVQMTQDLALLGAHFVNARYALDGVFDPAKPEILLYAKIDGQWTLVGLSYASPFSGTETPPDGFAGPLDVWHYHTGLCFRGQSVISSQLSDEQCRQAGGRFLRNTGWMAHLWLYLESPEGLFAHQNSLLKGSGAVLSRAELATMQ